MKNSLKYILIAALACGLTSSYFLYLAEPKVKEVPVIQIVEKPVEKIVEIEKEVEKIIYKKRSCPKINKEKLCSEYMANQKTEALDDTDSKISSNSSLELPSMLKNRVNFLVGYGKKGSKVNVNGSSVNVEPENGAVFGAQYERKVGKRSNVNFLIQSNTTFSVGAGYEF